MVAKNRFFYMFGLVVLTFCSMVFSGQENTEIITKELKDENFKVVIQYPGDISAKEKAENIFNMIKNLIEEIDSVTAAKGYLNYLQTIFETFKENDSFSIVAKKGETMEQVLQKLKNYMQELTMVLTKKENILKQAVWFTAFSDLVIKEINDEIVEVLQSYFVETTQKTSQKMQQTVLEKKDDEEIVEIELVTKDQLTNLCDKMFNAVKGVLEKHYNI
jgi:hypothetical protein